MRGIGDNKKGQQMGLGAIIAIILGLVVLVFLIFGFTKGWGNLWDNIVNIGGSDSNVNTVTRGCEVACIGGNTYDYCKQVRMVKYGDSDKTVHEGSCYALRVNETSNKMFTLPYCAIDCGKSESAKIEIR